MIFDWLEKEKLDFKKCKGKWFDNAASMAGVYSDVQHFLWNINGKAKFVPWSNHSLNLYGVHASAVNTSAITFFGVIFMLFQSLMGNFIFTCEGHDEAFGIQPLEHMLWSYLNNLVLVWMWVSLIETGTGWYLNCQSIKVKQSARKWKFQLKSKLEERESYQGKGRWCMSNTWSESKEKSLQMLWLIRKMNWKHNLTPCLIC